jgi:periplasmic divalent cation tolerance protein
MPARRPPVCVPAGFRYLAATMTTSSDIQIIFCTAPDADTGRRIATQLVKDGLAACVNLIPGIESIYRWKGQLECDSEVLLMIKARSADYAGVEATISALHPYELPEIIAVPLSNGLSSYLEWVRSVHDEAK